MAEVIEGAMQQAAQLGRQSMDALSRGDGTMDVIDKLYWQKNVDSRIIANGKYSQQGVFMAKSATFGALHVVIAFGVSYALSRNLVIAGAITLVEPLVNTVAHYFFDRWWGRPALLAAVQRWRQGRQQGTAPAT